MLTSLLWSKFCFKKLPSHVIKSGNNLQKITHVNCYLLLNIILREFTCVITECTKNE